VLWLWLRLFWNDGLVRLSWEVVMKWWLRVIFEWWFYEIVMKVLLNEILERLSWEIVLKSWLNDVFEWWFYEIVLKFLLNEVFEWWFYDIVLIFLLNEVFEWWFYEIVLKWWWKCREGCRVMMMIGRWARPTLTTMLVCHVSDNGALTVHGLHTYDMILFRKG